MLSRLFRPSASKRAAEALYAATVAQARTPAFFERLGAPDTVEGRFDVLVLHVHLLLRRLRGEGEAASSVGQLLFDVMFKDMDASLREMGVGDLVISKRMQKLVSALYG
ncbi:MAG: ubiquinol-cytochrome C chaperone family protein, partial [Pseudomonadota bacterium]